MLLWLQEVGVSLHLGHSGDLCLVKSMHHYKQFNALDLILKATVT